MPVRSRIRFTARHLTVVVAVGLGAVLASGCLNGAPSASSIPHGPPGFAPIIAGFSCPVTGARYGQRYGPLPNGGYHFGVDLLAPSGTALVAVMAGSVHYVANEGAGGNAMYLYGVDGNVYYYAHMLAFWGGDRRVGPRELVGLVGQTGNATGPHLHFEIRLGGPNGMRVDPFPTLQNARC